MTPRQLELIPDHALHAEGTRALRDWLRARGWTMTLLELDAERRRRKGQVSITSRRMLPRRRHGGAYGRPGAPSAHGGPSVLTAVAAPNPCAPESHFFETAGGG